jgi:hypothetical protein
MEMSKLVLAMADMKENPMNIHKLTASNIGSFGVFLVGNKVFLFVKLCTTETVAFCGGRHFFTL